MPVDLTRAVFNQLHLQKKNKWKVEEEHKQPEVRDKRNVSRSTADIGIVLGFVHLAVCDYFSTYHLTSNLDLLISQLLTANKGSLNRHLKLSPLERVRLPAVTLVCVIQFLQDVCKREQLGNCTNVQLQCCIAIPIFSTLSSRWKPDG